MARVSAQLSTGLPELDRVFRGLMPGDNIVWQVDSIADYLPFVDPFVQYARTHRQRLVYFRFADHPALTQADEATEVRELHPEAGFEAFLAAVHHDVSEAGRGSLYLFDCLSELAADWCSDRMLGNFFALTCPYLYDRAAVAYFAILRNYHSFHAVRPISSTTQILVDAYRYRDKLYIHPIKVQYRHSPTMYMLHEREGDEFVPVTRSGIVTEVLAGLPWSQLNASTYLRGYWSKSFAEAETVQAAVDHGAHRRKEAGRYFKKLVRMLISHEEPVLRLAARYFTLPDLLAIRRRMIGTGLIGGKSVGMLLARAILQRSEARWADILEAHDSFFVGADVFYTYLVQNGCWWMMQKQKQRDGGFRIVDETETARRRILAGEFPEYIVQQFSDMLDYFGQSPIIVRSSSLLEDNFGNAFAGKYESVFCANQGGPQKRLEDFLFAVRTVYASTMSEDALYYRAQRGLLGLDEQMALLIQRVSGARYGHFYYPQAAGVGFSFNPYVWHESIDQEAGMIRLVFGVGTRAVERADDDYTRVVALNAPTRRPEANFDEVRQYAQHRVDVLDLEANQMTSLPFEEVALQAPDLPVDMFADRDRQLERRVNDKANGGEFPWVLTFTKLLSQTEFVPRMRDMLRLLENAYEYPVDIEFTLNFFAPDSYRINLVQCRPLQVTGPGATAAPPPHIAAADVALESHGPVIGKSATLDVDWVIYVVPHVYGQLPVRERYAVARVIGELTRHRAVADTVIMLLGPGRWGTTTPALGVPVSFAEIHAVSALCEIVTMREGLIPDVSLGTHFFNELVENSMLYVALFPSQTCNRLDRDLFETGLQSHMPELLPDWQEYAEAVRLLAPGDLGPGATLRFHADSLKQRVLCYRSTEADGQDQG